MTTNDTRQSPATPEDDIDTYLDHLLGDLHGRHRAAIAAIGRVAELSRGDRVVGEGERAPEIGYLLDGALGMQKCLSDGRTHIIGLLVPADMYGRLFDGASAYDIVALTDARVLTFPRDAFESILKEAPAVERLFLVSVLDELDSAREWILLMGGRKIVERVASFLLILLRRKLRSLSAQGLQNPSLSLRIPIRRSDLAHYLGTTPESLSRSLHELEKEGIVRLEDAYTLDILDLSALVRVSGADHLLGGEV
jgi:CRP/FNR family transcriptional regulator